ncbi:hypothetical protein Angca_008631 [Angiostrongylus cantonensis]|nr:hypothetical protein Angca_008631 [Angiostrongylus cantonensis]
MVVGWRALSGLLLPLVPTLAVFGNVLVIMAVYKEKCLQTVTNMLIVSLAVSDFLVAICVMSFGVYYERNDFKWSIGQFFCNLYLASDVTCSTASILNLLAISLDRYIAISHPISYAQYGARGGRAIISISIVWAVSVIVGLPILLGVNPMEENLCEFSNAYFNILSSLLSFFFPCTAMIVLYTVIFRRLRQRGRARNLRNAAWTDRCKVGLIVCTNTALYYNLKSEIFLKESNYEGSGRPSWPMKAHRSQSLTNVLHQLLLTSITYPTAIFDILKASKLNERERERERERESVIISLPYCEARREMDPLQQSATIVSVVGQRSYGDALSDIIPYIDDIGYNISMEDLSNDLKAKDPCLYNSEPTSGNVVMQDEENNTSSGSSSCTSSNRSFLKDRTHRTPSSTFLFHVSPISVVNSTLRANDPSIMEQHVDLVNNEDVSFADSVRLHKGHLWKRCHKIFSFIFSPLHSKCRVMNGWGKTRPSQQLVKKVNKQMRREHKATVTLAVVLAVFLFCWLPFFTLHLINSICLINEQEDGCMGVFPLFLATWLGYINSSLNPLIYTVFDQRFRNAFRAILCRGIVRR